MECDCGVIVAATWRGIQNHKGKGDVSDPLLEPMWTTTQEIPQKIFLFFHGNFAIYLSKWVLGVGL